MEQRGVMLGLRAFLCVVVRCSHCLPLKLCSGCRLKAACFGVLWVLWPSADLLCKNRLHPNSAERSNTFLAMEGGCKRESNERYGDSQRSWKIWGQPKISRSIFILIYLGVYQLHVCADERNIYSPGGHQHLHLAPADLKWCPVDAACFISISRCWLERKGEEWTPLYHLDTAY